MAKDSNMVLSYIKSSRLYRAFISPNKETVVLKERVDRRPIPSGEERRYVHRLKKIHNYTSELTLEHRRAAILQAESPVRPNRQALYALYKRAKDDGHVISVLNTRINNLLSEDFVLRSPSGTLDEDAKALLRKPWFFQFCQHALNSVIYGHSLIEFGKLEEGEFKNVYLIPREHVNPVWGMLLMNPSDVEGVPYREIEEYEFMIEVGEHEDLGLMQTISKHVAIKNWTTSDWSRRNERFGQPLVTLLTDSQDKEQLDEKEQWLANLGRNGYAILSKEDELEFHESSQTDAHETFENLIDKQDKYISKVVLGQTMTTDDGASLSQAKVHENVMDSYTEADLNMIAFVINLELIPFLTKHGYPLNEYTFEFWRMTEEYKEQEAEKKKLRDTE